MTAQFLHISIFGRKSRKGAARYETAQGMLNEAGRLPSASQHIPNPTPPQLLSGQGPMDIAKSVKKLSATSRDSRGRKLRSDAGLLMCIVASYPKPLDQMSVREEYEKWQSLALDWLRLEFGDYLAGAVLHEDEPYGHIHAFVLPAQTADGQLVWEDVHPGRRAKRAALASGASSQDQDMAYLSAMRQMQDDFHNAVSSHLGHDRLTSRRERRTRDTHFEILALEKKNLELTRKVAELESELFRLAVIAPVNSKLETILGANFPQDDFRDYLDYESEETRLFDSEGKEDDIGPDVSAQDIDDASEIRLEEQHELDVKIDPDDWDFGSRDE
jgi:hypothetical protein